MASLSTARAERAVAELSRLAVAGLERAALLDRVAAAIHPVVPFDAYCGSATDPASHLIQVGVADGMGAELPDADQIGRRFFDVVYFDEDLPQIRAMLRDGESVRSLLAATDGEPERSLRYRALLQPFGFADEAGVLFVDKGLQGGLDLMRGSDLPDYSRQELAFLQRVAPIVGAGLRAGSIRAAADHSEESGGDGGPGVLVVDAAGRLRSVTAAARRHLAVLERSGDIWRNDAPPLPPPVLMVLGALDRAVRPANDADRRVVPRLRVRTQAGAWLSIHADLTEPSADRPADRVVVIAPASAPDAAWLQLAGHGLTDREEEVVRLVVAGLSTRQMADKLFIAEHTVQRHLSNVFEKVGVRSRRELVKRIFTEQILPALA